MTEPSDKWQDLLDQMTAGEAVDWDTQDIADDKEASLLQQLKHIHSIQQVFSASLDDDPNPTIDEQPSLFAWGHLHVKERLGEGGYGEVYRAFDPVLNRDVALKLLKPDQLAGFHSKLFIEEAQRIAQVRNRHVLAIHGAGVNDGQVGFWSDLIVGDTLVDRTHVSHEELLKTGTALSQALQAVHDSGLVHGDVKAANVMLDQNNQYVLMDFGAGLESGSEHPSNHSVGSPMLMAPELFQEADKTPASDIYALGCLLFKMATGIYPVSGNNVLDIVQAHQSATYFRLGEQRPDLPNSMQQLIDAMLSTQPDERPTAEQVIQRLNLIKDEPRRKKKRRLVMGIMASLLIGLVLSTAGLIYANHERQKAVQEQQKTEAVNGFLQQILVSASRFGQGREVRVADMLDVAAKNKAEKFKDQPHANFAISIALGRSYGNLQLYDKSLAEFSESVALAEDLYGSNDPLTLDALLRQAKAQRTLGLLEESARIIDAVIEQTKGQHDKHNLHQSAKVNKANLLTEQGQFDEAESLFKQVIATRAVEGQSAPNYRFLAMTGLASNYNTQSKYEQALELVSQAHDIFLADPKSIKSNEMVVFDLQGVALAGLGRYTDAEIVMAKNLELAELYFGKKNLGYLQMLTNHATILYYLKRYEEALLDQQTALQLSNQVAGKDQRIEVVMKLNLANTLVAMDDLKAGLQMMREALVLSTETLGESDIETLILEYNLAELMNKMGQHQEAKALSESSLGKANQALGEQHLVTLLMQDNLAVSLHGMGQIEVAVNQHQQLLPQMIAHFGQQSPHTQMVWQHLVDSLVAADQINSAIAQQQSLVNALREQHGGDHVEVLTAQQRLDSLLME